MARQAAAFSEGILKASVVSVEARRHMGLKEFMTNPRMLLLLLGTAGTWFLFDYAYYGNTLSLPAILKGVDPHATLEAKLAWTLAIFVVFAVPGYALAVVRMDRIGHKRLQLVGFTVMTVAFAARRRGSPAHRHSRAVPPRLRSQLLLRRVRAEHDDIRPAV